MATPPKHEPTLIRDPNADELGRFFRESLSIIGAQLVQLLALGSVADDHR